MSLICRGLQLLVQSEEALRDTLGDAYVTFAEMLNYEGRDVHWSYPSLSLACPGRTQDCCGSRDDLAELFLCLSL